MFKWFKRYGIACTVTVEEAFESHWIALKWPFALFYQSGFNQEVKLFKFGFDLDLMLVRI